MEKSTKIGILAFGCFLFGVFVWMIITSFASALNRIGSEISVGLNMGYSFSVLDCMNDPLVMAIIAAISLFLIFLPMLGKDK